MMTNEHLLRYLNAYSAGDLTALGQYYAPDIVFESFGGRRKGSEVVAFLTRLHESVRDHIQPVRVEFGDQSILLEAQATITALQDVPWLPAGAMKAGEKRVVPMTIRCEVRGDRFTRIVVS